MHERAWYSWNLYGPIKDVIILTCRPIYWIYAFLPPLLATVLWLAATKARVIYRICWVVALRAASSGWSAQFWGATWSRNGVICSCNSSFMCWCMLNDNTMMRYCKGSISSTQQVFCTDFALHCARNRRCGIMMVLLSVEEIISWVIWCTGFNIKSTLWFIYVAFPAPIIRRCKLPTQMGHNAPKCYQDVNDWVIEHT